MMRHPDSQRLAAGETASFACAAAGEGPLTYRWLRDGAEISGAAETTYTIEQAALADDGAAFTCAATNARGETVSRPARLTVVPGSRPAAVIDLPQPDALYAAGDTITFAGSGQDADDGTLPPEALTWEVEFHFTRFAFPFLPPQTGMSEGSFVVPTTGQTSTSVFYRINLTVTDSTGLSAHTYVDVQPRVVLVDFVTEPPGLNVVIENNTHGTPHRMVSVAGMLRGVSAQPQTVDGVNYVFDRWSDAGAAEHAFVTPDTDTTVTVYFRQE
jgi:hypothetical protein